MGAPTPDSILKRKHPRTWSSYSAMNRRCYDENFNTYQWYGALGVKVCARWRRSFTAFTVDMGIRPLGKTIDRVNSNRDYEPRNCRWSSCQEQSRNKRRHLTATFNGEARLLKEWAEILNISYHTLYDRKVVQKLTDADILTGPTN